MFSRLWRKYVGAGRGGGKQEPCREGKSADRCPPESSAQEAGEGDGLDALSNRANDLIRRGKWEEAQRVCERLRQAFPDELDADDRLAQLYEARGNRAKALFHAQAALRKARGDPQKFDPELVAELEQHVASLDGPPACMAAGRQSDKGGKGCHP